jgi:hypothetical protein
MIRSILFTTLAILIGIPALLIVAISLGILNLDPRHGNRRFNPPSIDIARSQHLLVVEPTIETPKVQWRDENYRIHQVWIDQLVDEDIFFQRSIAGHRLKVQMDHFSTGGHLVCNRSIEFRSALLLNDNTALWFAEVTEPFPRSVSCKIKANH